MYYSEPKHYVEELMKSIDERIKAKTDDALKSIEKKAQELKAGMGNK